MILLYLKALRTETSFRRVRGYGKPVAALWMLGLWLALLTLSASERLHHFLHDQAAHPEHNCLVTGFANGSIADVPVIAVVPAAVELISEKVSAEPARFLERSDLRLAPGRAPPVFLVLL